ncbi:hypothetical protein [Mycobacterium heckeshornense]|uniref:hypothetical protein n=1 Tax=Mycobacterium heckeshornense TaxID=110505 RepID=UPI001944FABE|nr:hypothetical protein [Mycobacterium heckeshornense]
MSARSSTPPGCNIASGCSSLSSVNWAGDFSYQSDADPGGDITELLQVERVPG